MEFIPQYYLYKRIVQAKLFIDANYAGNIDLTDIAGEACFSKFHFIRLFRMAYGKTPYQYLTFVRLTQAKLLLKNGMAVSETCYRLGFESPGSFSALFKRFAGHSPLKYQQMEREKKELLKSRPLQFVPNCFLQ